MAFTPSSVSLTWKKTFSLPFVFVKVPIVGHPVNFQVTHIPNWASLIRETYDEAAKELTFKLTLNIYETANLAPGSYSGTIKAKEQELWGGPPATHEMAVSLKVVDTVRLSISKSDFTFNYNVGEAPPASQLLIINTENAWSIVADKPWVTFTASNGIGNQSISIGVNVAGLAPAIYTAGFIVDDGRETKIGTVNLLVSGDINSEDFLEVNPTALNFSELLGAAPTSAATVKINTSLAVDITTENPWLQLSSAAFQAGTHELNVSTINTEGIPAGNHIGSIKVISGYGTKIVNVLLRIVEIVTDGIASDGFYYARDRNILFLSTTAENAEALLDITCHLPGTIKTYSKRVPFFENTIQTVIGLETEPFLKPFDLPVLQSGLSVPVQPVVYDIRVFDKLLNSSALTERQFFSNMSFINGHTPAVEGKLSYVPSKITVPLDGIVTFSFITEDLVGNIEITGDINQVIAVNQPAGKIFTAMVDLSDFALAPGNKINISCGPTSIEVRVRASDIETFQLVWLNEWNCPEIMNLDGLIEIIEEDDSRTIDVAQAGKIIKRIIDIKEPKTFRVGTGNIYSEAELKWLTTILRSNKMWLEIKGERTEVVRTFRNQSIFKTREFNRNRELTFDTAIR